MIWTGEGEPKLSGALTAEQFQMKNRVCIDNGGVLRVFGEETSTLFFSRK